MLPAGKALKRAFGPGVKTRNLVGLFIVGLALAALAGSARAQSSLTLAWGPSMDPSVIGYRVYEGGVSHVYTNVVDTGNTTSNRVQGLRAGATYFFCRDGV